MDITQFEIHERQRGSVSIEGSSVTIRADAGSNWFAEPGTKIVEETAPVVMQPIDAPVFMFQAKLQVEFATVYDGGTLFIKSPGGQWAKLAYEYTAQGNPIVVSVVTKDTSDDSDGPIHRGGSVYLRIYRNHKVFAFHFSEDGKVWRFLRWFELAMHSGPLIIGLSAQSPSGRGCTAKFSDVGLSFTKVVELRSGI